LPSSARCLRAYRIARQVKRLEQLEAKLTCMCGDYVDHHSMGSGHSPVSMYDYSLSRAEEENELLKARVTQLERRLEEVFP
jgi:BMFP domain-containing protein YqiC